MVINLTTLTGKLATVHVEFMGQSTKVMYDPLRITQASITKSQESDELFAETFTEVIRSWDVQRSGKKVPLTLAGLTNVPLPLLKAIYSAVFFGTVGEIEAEGKASSDG